MSDPTMEELRQRLLPHRSKSAQEAQKRHQKQQFRETIFSKQQGPVDVDDFLPSAPLSTDSVTILHPQRQRQSSHRSSHMDLTQPVIRPTPRTHRLIRSNSTGSSTTYTTATSQGARNVSHRSSKSTGRSGTPSSSSIHRDAAHTLRRTRAMSPPVPSTQRTLQHPPPIVVISPSTRAPKYDALRSTSSSSSTRGPRRTNSLTPQQRSKQNTDHHQRDNRSTTTSSLSAERLRVSNPRQYAAQYYASKLKQQPDAAATRQKPYHTMAQPQFSEQFSVEQDSLADILDNHQSSFHTTSTPQRRRQQERTTNNVLTTVVVPSSEEEEDTAQPTRRRSEDRYSMPITDLLLSPDQVSRQHHAQRIRQRNATASLTTKHDDSLQQLLSVTMESPRSSTKRTSATKTVEKTSPTSIIADLNSTLPSTRPFGYIKETQDGGDFDVTAAPRRTLNDDDGSLRSFASLPRMTQQQRPFDESASFDVLSKDDRSYSEDHKRQQREKPRESKYSRAIRHLATQDETIHQLQQQIKAAAAVREDHDSLLKERDATICELQSQLACSHDQCNAVQSQLARVQSQVAQQSQELDVVSSSHSFRERIRVEDALREEIAKNQQAREENALLCRQVAELKQQVAKLRQISEIGMSPGEPATDDDIRDRSFASTITTAQDDSPPAQKKTDSQKRPLLSQQPKESSSNVGSLLKLPKAHRGEPEVSSNSVELDRASSCVTEIITNTTKATSNSNSDFCSLQVQSEIAELKAALASAQSMPKSNKCCDHYPRSPPPRKHIAMDPPIAAASSDDASLRDQLNAVRVARRLNTGQATGERATTMNDGLDNEEETNFTLPPRRSPGAFQKRGTEVVAPRRSLDSSFFLEKESTGYHQQSHSEDASLDGAKWKAVGDEEVQTLLKELQQMKNTVSSNPSSSRQPQQPHADHPDTNNKTANFAFSNIGIPDRRKTNGGNGGQHDDDVMDRLRRRLG